MGDIDLNDFNQRLDQMIARASNPQKPLAEIGAIMVSEMQTNIEVGGRPQKWEESERVNRKGGQTLRDSGTLMHGVVFEVGENTVAAGPTMLGRNHVTDPRAMKLLAFGGDVKRFARSELFQRKRVARGPNKGRFKRGTVAGQGMTFKEHTAHYPARDFTYIPPERRITFGNIVQSYLVE